MKVNIQNEFGAWETYESDSISLELDNKNEVRITEIESGVLEVENISEFAPLGDLGLLITPQNYSTVHIIPEG